MFNSILIVIGIMLMIFSVYRCIRIIKINSVKKLQIPLYAVLVLIIFFLFGYIAYLFLSTSNQNIPISSLLICLIFFFGAIFVKAVLRISYQLIDTLTQKTIALNQANETLTHSSDSLKNKQDELLRTQDLLKQKNKELRDTLDNFYTVRIDMQKNIDAGKLDEENIKIKEKIDNLNRE